jgi:glycosyltransferase involved in cell wall biosynthesis
MEIKKVVSVIILYFNQPDYIFDALKSVLIQDYENIELIIADDASQNINKKEIEDYIAKNARKNISSFKIITQLENVGTVRNINLSILLAKGKYIKVFAADDVLYSSNVLTRQVAILEKDNTLAVTGKLMQCDNNLEFVFDKSVHKNNVLLPKMLSMNAKKRERFIIRNNLFPYITQSMLFSRKFFDVVGFYNEQYFLIEDIPMMWKIMDKLINVSFIDEYVIKHRIDTGVTKKAIFVESESYANDCVLQLRELGKRTKNPLTKIDCWCRQKLFLLRYNLSRVKGRRAKAYIIIKNIFPLFLFSLMHPRKMSIMFQRRP